MTKRILIHAAGVLLLCAAGCAHRGGSPPRSTPHGERVMEVTGYCKCGSCCGWKRNWYGRAVYRNGPNKGRPKDVGITASGTRAGRGTLAADTKRYPFGTVMYIPGYGYGRVEDRGGAIRGDRVDLFFNSHREAQAWGRVQRRVRYWLPD